MRNVPFDASRQIVEWFVMIEIREHIVAERGRVFGTNDVGVEKEFIVQPGALLCWGESTFEENGQKPDPWPKLVGAKNVEIYNVILDKKLVGPEDEGRLGCLDETPYYPSRTEIFVCVFPEDGESGYNMQAHDEAAWTLLLLTFSEGSVGQSLLIGRSESKSCREADLIHLRDAPLSYTQSPSGSISDVIFHKYVQHLVTEYSPTIAQPLYIQLDAHGSRSVWPNAKEFVSTCLTNNIYCLFDPVAFSQTASVVLNSADTTDCVDENGQRREKKGVEGNIRKRSIQAVTVALQSMNAEKHHEIRRGYKKACLQVPFSIEGFRDHPERFNVGDSVRCQSTMARSTKSYLEQVFSPENICMPRGSPIYFRSMPVRPDICEDDSVSVYDHPTIMATTRKVSNAKTGREATMIWKMDYHILSSGM
tara:strand:+ start:1482 stop:2744 length:1263 start_codon:yes stop_codon:yes gene_type:complete